MVAGLLSRLVGCLLAAIGVGALILALLAPVERAAPAAAKPPPPAELRELRQDTGGAERYDLSFDLEIVGAGAELRLFTSYPTGIYARVGPERAVLGRLGAGLELDEVGSRLFPSARHRVTLRRRGGRFVLLVDGSVAAVLAADFIPTERFAVTGQVRMTNVSLTPMRESVLFGDDFMREMSEPSPWETLSGGWETVGLKNPTLSANPFRLSSVGADALSVSGRPTWDEYHAAVSMLGAAGQSMGLAFSWTQPGEYFLFRWHSIESSADAEVIRYHDGGYSLLAAKPVRYAPGIWYRVDLYCTPGRARILIDEQPVFEVEHAGISGGRIGLYASGIERTWFDDVVVGPWAELSHGGKASDGLYRPLCGDWQQEAGALVARRLADVPVSRQGGAAAVGLFVTGSTLSDAVVKGVLASGRGGLAVGVADPLNFACLAARAGRLELLLVRDGVPKELASSRLEHAAGDLPLELRVERGVLTGSGGGQRLTVPVDAALYGAAGLVAFERGVRFRLPVTASIPPRREAILTGNATFSAESSMSAWAGEMSDWALGEHQVYWYQGFFPGDIEITAELAECGLPEAARLALGVNKSGADTALNGYNLLVERLPAADKNHGPLVTLSLHREGQKVAEKPLPLDKVYSASLRAVDGAVQAGLNGLPALTWLDPRPGEVAGYKVAYKADRLNLAATSVFVTSPFLYDYRFETAPVDWRPAAGIWEVANRWQCDPRWSFFSGVPKSGERLVLAWNKRRFRDPIRVEFYVAPKMQGERGDRYEYVRDFNISLSPEATDTLAGYSFMFGGFDNSKSAIVRKGQVVASSAQSVLKRGSMWLHRHWYHVLATKEGGDLRFVVDGGNSLDLSFKDPEPLAAGRVAIWTYDCAIMVSRVRISGGGGEVAELPGAAAGYTPRTVYNLVEGRQ